MYQSFFYGHCFTCTNFGHKAVDSKSYGRNIHVDPYNIECCKCNNYGHITFDWRSMMDISMKENTVSDIRGFGKENKNKKIKSR
jgi:hypothetical protein